MTELNSQFLFQVRSSRSPSDSQNKASLYAYRVQPGSNVPNCFLASGRQPPKIYADAFIVHPTCGVSIDKSAKKNLDRPRVPAWALRLRGCWMRGISGGGFGVDSNCAVCGDPASPSEPLRSCPLCWVTCHQSCLDHLRSSVGPGAGEVPLSPIEVSELRDWTFFHCSVCAARLACDAM